MIFSSGIRITQKFGANPDWYKPYGFLGHEGLDCVPANLSDSWDILSPEKIEIVRDIDTPRDNYGIYVVGICWETMRSWWFCHMEKNYCKIGDIIEKGQAVGKMGNTGNSTAAHLHIGVRNCDNQGNPLNTDNGYKGFIDPEPLLKGDSMSVELDTCMADRAKFWKERDEALIKIDQLQAELDKTKDNLEIANSQVRELKESNSLLVANKESLEKTLSNQSAKVIEQETTIKELTDKANSQSISIVKLEDEIKKLKLIVESMPQNDQTPPSLANVIALFRRWLISWLSKEEI